MKLSPLKDKEIISIAKTIRYLLFQIFIFAIPLYIHFHTFKKLRVILLFVTKDKSKTIKSSIYFEFNLKFTA